MKIMVTGHKGMLGSVLVKRLEERGHQVLGFDLPEDNLLDYPSVQRFIEDNNIEFVYNCAAFTNVDLCETEFEKAEAINALAVKNLAQLCRKKQIPLLQLSTDYVFDGTAQKPYETDSPRKPISAYGVTKAEGEKYLQTENPEKYFIVRTAWLYGKNGKNFVETILKMTEEKKEIKVVNDQKGAPTYTNDLAEALINFLDCKEYGIYHFTNTGTTTWYEFAREFLRLLGKTVKVIPCTTEEFPRPARRPAYSVLSLKKYENTFQQKIPTWQDAISRYLEDRRNNL